MNERPSPGPGSGSYWQAIDMADRAGIDNLSQKLIIEYSKLRGQMPPQKKGEEIPPLSCETDHAVFFYTLEEAQKAALLEVTQKTALIEAQKAVLIEAQEAVLIEAQEAALLEVTQKAALIEAQEAALLEVTQEAARIEGYKAAFLKVFTWFRPIFNQKSA